MQYSLGRLKTFRELRSDCLLSKTVKVFKTSPALFSLSESLITQTLVEESVNLAKTWRYISECGTYGFLIITGLTTGMKAPVL